MLRHVNILRYVRKYQLALAVALVLMALFVLAHPPVPKDLNYRYQLTPTTAGYPLVRETAGLVTWSTERVREVYRWNLTAETVAQAMPDNLAGTPSALTAATFFIIVGAAAMLLIWFSPSRRLVGMGLIVFVLAGSHLAAHAATYTRFMAWPSTVTPNAAATLVISAEPGHTAGVERETAAGLKDLSDRYWDHYVAFTQHRMGTAGTLVPSLQRVWFGISGLLYVLPFAMVVAMLSSLTVLVQTLAWALMMVAPLGLAVALADGRAGLRVWQHVVAPLLTAILALAVLGVVLPLMLFSATAVHAFENEIGVMLIGSIVPILMVVGVGLLLRRQRMHRRLGALRRRRFGHGPEYLAGRHQDHDRTAVLGAEDRTLRFFDPDRRRDRE